MLGEMVVCGSDLAVGLLLTALCSLSNCRPHCKGLLSWAWCIDRDKNMDYVCLHCDVDHNNRTVMFFVQVYCFIPAQRFIYTTFIRYIACIYKLAKYNNMPQSWHCHCSSGHLKHTVLQHHNMRQPNRKQIFVEN